MTHWSANYIGIPFRAAGRDRNGVDCWGLVRLVYGEHLNIYLPSYNFTAQDEIVPAVTEVPRSAPWTSIGGERETDVLVFRYAGFPAHVAVAIGRGRMLHVTRGTLSRLERFDVAPWARRKVATYRHSELQ